MNTAIQDKILFSHDHPVVNTKKLLREFEELPLTPEVKRKIQEENPRRFLGI
jgi:predicted TIM-barrel fold metal-dependent hydrolase